MRLITQYICQALFNGRRFILLFKSGFPSGINKSVYCTFVSKIPDHDTIFVNSLAHFICAYNIILILYRHPGILCLSSITKVGIAQHWYILFRWWRSIMISVLSRCQQEQKLTLSSMSEFNHLTIHCTILTTMTQETWGHYSFITSEIEKVR